MRRNTMPPAPWSHLHCRNTPSSAQPSPTCPPVPPAHGRWPMGLVFSAVCPMLVAQFVAYHPMPSTHCPRMEKNPVSGVMQFDSAGFDKWLGNCSHGVFPNVDTHRFFMTQVHSIECALSVLPPPASRNTLASSLTAPSSSTKSSALHFST